MILQTERLVICKLSLSDLGEFEKTLNDSQLSCMGGSEGFLNWLIRQYENMDIVNGLISFGVFDKATGKLLGTAGAGKHDDLHEPEIFYILLPENRGKCYATEAVKAITTWVFDNYDIPYLIGTVSTDNIKSQKVLEQCDYQFIDKRILLVHVEDKKYEFKYYRYYSVER